MAESINTDLKSSEVSSWEHSAFGWQIQNTSGAMQRGIFFYWASNKCLFRGECCKGASELRREGFAVDSVNG